MENCSALYPPNVHELSERVIGKVIPSPLWSKPGVGQAGDNNAWSSTTTSYANSRPLHPQQSQDSVSPTWPIPTAPLVNHKGMLHSSQQHQLAEHVPIAHAKTEVEIHKQRSRTSMQRLRKKLQDHGIALERDIGKLREETQKLQLQSQTLSFGVPTGISALTVVAEYFRLFRYGLKSSAKTNDHGSSTKLATSAQVSSVQRDFLKAAVSPDVAGETGFGVEKLIEDYRHIARFLPDSDTQLVRLDTGPKDSLTATTTVTIVITASMLHCTFPHLVNGGGWAPTRR